MKRGKVFISFIFVGVLAFSLYKILEKQWRYKEGTSTYEEIKEISYGEEEKSFDDRLNLMKGINSDYKFWIRVENTNIDYPVVQGRDNAFYLSHNFKGEEDISGCLFIDYRCNTQDDKNIIIYGHNMRNGSMFNSLNSYKEDDFFRKNNKIIVSDEQGERTFEIFSVFVASGEDDNFSSGNINEYIDLVKGKSMYESDVVIGKMDRIITLVSCSYEFKGARIVVVGKELSSE
ncbi:MAG: class B sortase [Clostridium sp.]